MTSLRGDPIYHNYFATTVTTTVYPKKYAHGFCFAVLCCGYILTDFPISTRLTSLALWQSNDCPSASKATLMNMDKYFMWIHYGRLHNHNKAKHNKTVCIFLGIYCILEHCQRRIGCYAIKAWSPSQYKDRLSRHRTPMLKTRWSQGRLIFNMGMSILVRRHLYIETATPVQEIGIFL